jgi:putative ABC transport system substrate-binding protein
VPSNLKTILWVSTEAQPDPFIASFREAMRDRGYVEGQNIAFTLQYAPGDPAALRARLPAIIGTPADLIVSSGPAILAMRATTDKPVLFAISGDPVALGIAQSFSRRGRNFTGSTFLSLDVAQKRVQIIRELLPNLRTLAILSQKNHPGEPSEYEANQQVADALGVRLSYVPFASGAEVDNALQHDPPQSPRRSSECRWSGACVISDGCPESIFWLTTGTPKAIQTAWSGMPLILCVETWTS